MANDTQGTQTDEVIIDEEPSGRSRANLTIASGVGAVAVGQVLELSGTEYVLVATAGSAAAVATEAVDATSAAKECICLVRECKVRKSLLSYNSLVEATVDAALTALGIIPQAGPTQTTL